MQRKNPLRESAFIFSSGEVGRRLRDNLLTGRLILRPKNHPDVAIQVNWQFCPLADGPRIRVYYRVQGEDLSDVVRLDTSDTCFGGKRIRWRFLCPGCEQRSNNLYLPINASRQKNFLCRLCWGIDYLSHVRPKRASMSSIQRLGNKIQTIEAEVVKLKRLHSGLLQSLGIH
jgi:hypothetical protein